MSVATKTFTVRELLQRAKEEDYFLVHDIDWDTYRRFVDGLGERRVFVTYDQGEMEFMTVSLKHDKGGSLIERFIDVLLDEFRLPCMYGGSTTFRREDLAKGIEPDHCLWIANEPRMRGKEEVDLTVDPPPDLGLEIDVSRSSLDRMGIYAALGIPEVWRLSERSLQAGLLEANCEYRWGNESRTFPGIPLQELVRFLDMADEMEHRSVVRKFRAWVKKQLKRKKKD